MMDRMIRISFAINADIRYYVQMDRKIHLSDFIDDLRKKGHYLFEKQEAIRHLHIGEEALKSSLARLSKKGKIGFLKNGLYQIIPAEYSVSGSLPPQWFVHRLMTHLGVPYYTGLLSAAALHGAAHQAPQIFQVVCSKPLRSLKIGSSKICFYFNKELSFTPIQEHKTPSGFLKVSTPEGTAIDLVRYIRQSGHLNHVSTVLRDLSDVLDKDQLATAAKACSIRYGQRLGYLLDFVGAESLTSPLYRLVSENSQRYVPLRADAPTENAEKNNKWKILVNEEIETD